MLIAQNDFSKYIPTIKFLAFHWFSSIIIFESETVAACKDQGELDELRAARTNFSKIFPLTEKLWLEWLNDEKAICQTEEEHQKLIKLFDSAIEGLGLIFFYYLPLMMCKLWTVRFSVIPM